MSASVKKMKSAGVKILSLDEQIALLESQLESDGSSSSDDYDDDNDYANDNDGSDCNDRIIEDKDHLLKVEKDRDGNVLRLVSKLDDDRIAPLPKSQLPSIHCSFKTTASKTGPKKAKSKSAKSDSSSNSKSGEGDRRIRFADEAENGSNPPPASSSSSSSTAGHKRQLDLGSPGAPPRSALKSTRLSEINSATALPHSNSNSNSSSSSSSSSSNNSYSSGIAFGRGLAAAVQELQKNYQPSSLEKRPFFCRACSHQAADLNEFEQHKTTNEHFQRVGLERKASSCQVCRKDFTSPEQLKEHLKGKWHIERMQTFTARQSSGKSYS